MNSFSSGAAANSKGSAGLLQTTPVPYILPAAPGLLVLHQNERISPADTRSLGSVGIGKTASLAFMLHNSGIEDLTGIALSINGADAADFSLQTRPPATLAGGASATFSVKFTSSSTAVRNARLNIASNDPSRPAFPLDLTASGFVVTPVPEIVVEQPAKTDLIDGKAIRSFGAVTLGRASNTRTFIVRNTGKAPLENLFITAGGKNAGDFLVLTPKIATIPAGGKITFRVIFKPKGTGARSATLRIMSNDADESPFDIKLVGQGTKGAKKGGDKSLAGGE